MIGHLRGKIHTLGPERLLLDVGGVGYAVHIPLSTYYELEAGGDGAEVALYIHTHLREGEIALFGFYTEREQLLFEKLIAVGGIGPRLARVILSGMPPEELLAALVAGDSGRLTAIPGVGKKTAERMVLELKDRVQELSAGLPTPTAVPSDFDVVSALVNLGYRQAQAEKAVARVRGEEPEAEFHELLRASLRILSRA
jgi:Holliday junction DNA helicase RuvA